LSGAYPAGERAVLRRLLKEQREGTVKLAIELARLLLDVRRATLVGLRVERALLVIRQAARRGTPDEVGLPRSGTLRLFADQLRQSFPQSRQSPDAAGVVSASKLS
jgi:hypothetical protein